MTEQEAKNFIWNRLDQWKKDTHEKIIVIPKPQYFMILGALELGADETRVRTQLDLFIQQQLKRIRADKKDECKEQTVEETESNEDLPF